VKEGQDICGHECPFQACRSLSTTFKFIYCFRLRSFLWYCARVGLLVDITTRRNNFWIFYKCRSCLVGYMYAVFFLFLELRRLEGVDVDICGNRRYFCFNLKELI
jgi:hypothetical protein